MRIYQCEIWNHDYTFGEEDAPAQWVASITVSARNEREAVGHAYVYTVGQERAKKLRELNSPQVIIDFESNFRSVAESFGRNCVTFGGDCCYSFDNRVETWYVTVKLVASSRQCAFMAAMRTSPRPERSTSQSEWLYRASQFFSLN